jgi:hypothetical protein
MKNVKTTNKSYLSFGLVLLTALITSNAVLAAGDNSAALKAMADSASAMFQGDLIRIAINGGGLAAIVYSIIGGFKPGPFLGGIGLIVFYALFRTYTTSFFG